MKFWKAWIPNLCISLWLALLTLVVLDSFNPTIGFLRGRAFLVLVGLCALSSLSSAVTLYGSWRRERRRAVDEQERP